MSTEPVVIGQPVSPDDIAMRLAGIAGAPRLYRASLAWYKVEYQGEWFMFPPDNGGAMTKHPITGKDVVGDGVFVVMPKVGTLWKEEIGRGKVNLGQGIRPGMQAQEIAKFILEHYSDRGVVLLDGGPAGEAAAKEESRARCFKSRQGWALTERARWMSTLDEFKKRNPGAALPAPTKQTQEAIEWLDVQADANAAKYKCADGCMQTNDFAVYARHMRAQHNQTVESGPAEKTFAEREAELKAREAALLARESEIEALTAPRKPKEAAARA